MNPDDAAWTLDDLTAEVAAALARDYGGASSGRVRDVPDRRTIRYYTTLGLIDRPAAMRGRTALYGPRHLLQLVAIKKLQAAGRSLSEIEAALAGQTDSDLAWTAGVTAPGSPEPEVPPVSGDASPADALDGTGERWTIPPVLVGYPLHPGVTLLLAATRAVEGTDLESIRTAAAPLIELLTRSRLVTSEADGSESRGGHPR